MELNLHPVNEHSVVHKEEEKPLKEKWFSEEFNQTVYNNIAFIKWINYNRFSLEINRSGWDIFTTNTIIQH